MADVVKGRPDGEIFVTATNLGDANTSAPVTIKDVLPEGLQVVAVEGAVDETLTEFGFKSAPLECSHPAASEAVCPFTGKPPTDLESLNPLYNGATFPTTVPPFDLIRMRVAVNVAGATSGALNVASVAGGGAAPVASRQPTHCEPVLAVVRCELI